MKKSNKTYQPRIERAQIDEPREIINGLFLRNEAVTTIDACFKNEPLDESATKFVQRDLKHFSTNWF